MTRKDYTMIAEAIRDAGEEARMTYGPDAPGLELLARSALYISDGMAQDNPRFDRKRFLAACGIDASAAKGA